MHDAAFARAARPPTVRLLRLALKPYSIGHELLLSGDSAAALPPALSAKLGANDLCARLARLYGATLQGVWICAHSWEETERLESELLVELKVWLWGRHARTQDLDLVGRQFEAYRKAGSSWPPCQTPADVTGREPGSPFLLRLHRFIMQDAGLSESAAWDYPLGLAQWRWCAYWEAQGRLDVLNEGEIDFNAWCEEQDRAAAARKSEGRSPKAEEVARA
jgi:hypothetical protein